MRLVKKLKCWVDNNGKECRVWNFYLEINGCLLPINSVFKSDRNVLLVFAEEYDKNNNEEKR